MASTAKGTVLVTGSTGRVGKEVIARLSKVEGFTVRAATRDKGDYAKSLGAHEVVKFDLTDKETWAPAMEGVTHLFSRYKSTHKPAVCAASSARRVPRRGSAKTRRKFCGGWIWRAATVLGAPCVCMAQPHDPHLCRASS